MRSHIRIAALAAALLALGAAACNGDDATVAPGDGFETVRALAPIELVEIRIAEPFTPLYFAHIVSAQPNGCVRFESLETERNGETIDIRVWNRVPAEGELVACTMIFGTTDHSVPLGTDFEAGRTYTLNVNDETITFEAQ